MWPDAMRCHLGGFSETIEKHAFSFMLILNVGVQEPESVGSHPATIGSLRMKWRTAELTDRKRWGLMGSFGSLNQNLPE